MFFMLLQTDVVKALHLIGQLITQEYMQTASCAALFVNKYRTKNIFVFNFVALIHCEISYQMMYWQSFTFYKLYIFVEHIGIAGI